MRVLAAFLLLAVALSGCGDDTADGGGPVASSSSASSAPPPPPLPTSDTLHFLAAPEMATALPSGGTEATTPVTVGNFGQQGNQPEGAEWRHTVERPTNVTEGEVRIWIEVKETLFHTPDSPATPSCTWSLTVAVGADNGELQTCVQEPAGPINPGTKELVFALAIATPIELEANETITVRLERSGFSLSANNAVDALSGSAEHDSRIRLAGLREPIRG